MSEDQRLTTYCDCSDPTHSMQFDMLAGPRDEPSLFVSVQLNPLHPWWKRIRYGLMYILGKRSQYNSGQWDEGGIDYASAGKLISLLRRFRRESDEYRKLQEEKATAAIAAVAIIGSTGSFSSSTASSSLPSMELPNA